MKITLNSHVNHSLDLSDTYIEGPATPEFQVEILPELGTHGKYKLYIHIGGRTVLRINQIESDQINVPRELFE